MRKKKGSRCKICLYKEISTRIFSVSTPVFSGTVDELPIHQNLSIYPNPFEQFFTIQLSQDKNFDLHILDMTGRTVMTKNGVSGNQTLNGSSFDTGTYLVRATGEKMILTGKLMKQ